MEIIILDNYISNCIKESKTPNFEEFTALNESNSEKDNYAEYMTEEIFELYVEYKTGEGVISLNEFNKIMSFEEFIQKMEEDEEDDDEGEEKPEGDEEPTEEPTEEPAEKPEGEEEPEGEEKPAEEPEEEKDEDEDEESNESKKKL
jgi:F0F1-type ATP synthase gamma subunit